MTEDDDEDNPPSLTKRDIVPPMASLGRGNRVRVPRQMFIYTVKGKDHDEGVYKGAGFPQVKCMRVECEMDHIKNHFVDARYSTKRGVINLQFDDDTPTPTKMT